MKSQIIFILAILCLLACNTKNKESSEMENHSAHSSEHIADDRTKELMAIHDSLMLSMDKLMNLRNQISVEIKKNDSLIAIKPNASLTGRKENAVQIRTQLEKADEEMMNWMHQYKADSLDKLGKEKAIAYVADQKQKIISVKNLMQKSIGDAQLFIQNK